MIAAVAAGAASSPDGSAPRPHGCTHHCDPWRYWGTVEPSDPTTDRRDAPGVGSIVNLDPAVASQATVLTIDDQPRFRAIARQLVDSVPGLRALAEAGSGQEGLALARSLQPDVVLLDINLPDIDGLEVCRRLHEEMTASRVILVSGDDEAEYSSAAHRCGAVAFVPKQRLTASLLLAILEGTDRPGAVRGTGGGPVA